MNINQELRAFGFTAKEITTYLALAEMGKAQAHLIAKKARISRTTVYPILYKLVDLGLVSLEKKRESSFFVANPPSTLLQVVLHEKEKIEIRERRIKDVIRAIAPLFKSRNFSVPKFQFFDGPGNVQTMLSQYLNVWFESMRAYDNTLWGFQDHTFVESYRGWLESYWKEKDSQHQIKLFSNKDSVERELKGKISKREMKSLANNLELGSTLWISGDFITLIMTRQQPHYAFQIQDTVFSTTLRTVFSCLWFSQD